MRKPKIGDIVHYCAANTLIYPAMLLKIAKSGKYTLHIFDGDSEVWIRTVAYSEKYEPGYWSWPEEEKPKYSECCIMLDNLEKVCKECGSKQPLVNKEEKKGWWIDHPISKVKGCEHTYWHASFLMDDIYTYCVTTSEKDMNDIQSAMNDIRACESKEDLLKRKNDGLKALMKSLGNGQKCYKAQLEKTGELIEKIWEISAKARLYSEERSVFDRLFRIYNLIQEYKGEN